MRRETLGGTAMIAGAVMGLVTTALHPTGHDVFRDVHGQGALNPVHALRRGSGVFGCVVAGLALLALLSGHLRLDVHGFGAVVLAQAAWLVLIGLELCGAGAVPAKS